MKISLIRRCGLLTGTAVIALVFVLQLSNESAGQSSKKKAGLNPAQLRQLELAKKKTLDDFVNNTVKLAIEYERAGLLEESKKLLQTVQRVGITDDGLKKKLDALEESIMNDNPFQFELDASKGWGDPVARLEKGKKVRIQSAGKYRFEVRAIAVGPAGFPSEDPINEMAKGVSCGALMALIVPVDAKGKAGKPGKPMEIGAGKEISPPENGLLFLAINAPPGHKCEGELDIQLSGYVRPVQ